MSHDSAAPIAPAPRLAPAAPPRHSARWVLAVGGALATVLGLGVHVVMLQYLNVPYPDHAAVPAVLKFINTWAAVLAAFVFYRSARARFDAMPGPLACLVMFALWAMLKEALIRAAVMDGVVTTAWVFSFVSALPRICSCLIAGSAVVVVGRFVARPRWLVAASLALSAIMVLLVDPALRSSFGAVLHAISDLAHDEVYAMPYGWQVMVPAFLTYAEPTVAAFFVTAMVWDELAAPRLRVVQIAVLVGAMKGALLPLALFSAFLPLPLPSALASEAQFTLEVVVTAVLVALTWQRFRARRVRAGSA